MTEPSLATPPFTWAGFRHGALLSLAFGASSFVYGIAFGVLARLVSPARRLRVVVDAGNGVAGRYGPELLRRIGCDVTELYCESDGSFLVPGSMTIRSLNRATGWRLPTSGPKTLNGLIVEYLEDIPQPGTSLKLKDYTLEIAKIEANKVRMTMLSLSVAFS